MAFMATASTFDALPVSPRFRGLARLKRVISFPAMLGALLVAGLFVFLGKFDIDPDVWWHLKVGQDILATHRWPTADVYSFTAHGAPWIAYEWLGEVLLASVQRAFGLRGLMVLDLALGSAIVLALYALAWLRSGDCRAAFLACMLLLSPIVFSCTMRPQMLGYLFLVLTLIILERFRQGHAGALWLLPPLFVAWVNTHGTFVIGLFALLVYLTGGWVEIHWSSLESTPWTASQRIRLGLVFAASLAALIATPYGTRLAAYPLDMALSQPINVSNVQEWQPMPFGLLQGKIFLAVLVGFLLAQVVFRPTWQLAEFTLFVVGVAAACLHARFFLVFVPFSAPLVAVILSRLIPARPPGKDIYVLNALLMTASVVLIVAYFPSRKQIENYMAGRWPVEAVRYIESHPPPRPMYNSYYYGGFLVSALDGRNKVFIDGRADAYERAGVLADYLRIERATPIALPLLGVYHVQSCLLQRKEALATVLAASPQWHVAYADEVSALFVRRQTGEQW